MWYGIIIAHININEWQTSFYGQLKMSGDEKKKKRKMISSSKLFIVIDSDLVRNDWISFVSRVFYMNLSHALQQLYIV